MESVTTIQSTSVEFMCLKKEVLNEGVPNDDAKITYSTAYLGPSAISSVNECDYQNCNSKRGSKTLDTGKSSKKASGFGNKENENNFKLVLWKKNKKLKWSNSKDPTLKRSLKGNDYLCIYKGPSNSNTHQKLKDNLPKRILKAVKRKNYQYHSPKKRKYCKKFIESHKQFKPSESVQMKENGDANLMWLLDFKVDTLFQQDGESESSSSHSLKSSSKASGSLSNNNNRMSTTQLEQIVQVVSGIGDTVIPTVHLTNLPFDPSNPEHAFTVDLGVIDDVANFEQVECPTSNNIIIEPLKVVEDALTTITTNDYEYSIPEITFDEQGKPRCTYTDLIERALTESGGLTVSEIYQWISDHYPFFKPDDDRWKNSVRHNLSINPYFKKGEKARSGAGHLWTISEESRALRPTARKKENECLEIPMSIENETDRAVANILGQYHLAKTNMEGGPSTDVIAPRPEVNSSLNTSSPQESSNNECKLMEVAPVYIEYGNNDFNTEFTIDLSSLHFPDPSAINFDDLMPGGLIVIRTNDSDLDEAKEKTQVNPNSSNYMEEYMVPTFSEIRNDAMVTETERVSGQLISEALTQGFETEKQDSVIQHDEERHQHICQEIEFERVRGSVVVGDSQEYMSLDSIDPLALQEVMNGTNGESTEEHYQLMSTTVFEPKDLGYCNFENEVTL